jgi:hypothetical protein
MVAWWWLLIVAWTSFGLGLIFWAVCVSDWKRLSEHSELDQKCAEVWERKEQNDAGTVTSSSTR